MAKKPAYQVLARKYRPQGFEEVLGQPAVSVTLKNALDSKRLHHAYLFTGPRGVGKTTMARILAKALNCVKGPTSQPCGECEPCREITGSSCLDVLEMDAASNTGVDNVRQVIIETVALAPSRDRYKVFIIDETHMLSTAAFNALLKTIEEPPAHVVFILATTEAAKVPATIASRCQRFKFRPVAVEVLAGHLAALAKKEGLAAEPAALELLSRNADGSLRDAVSLLDQCLSAGGGKVTEEMVRDMFGLVAQELLSGVGRAIVEKDAKGLAALLRRAYEEGVEPAQLVRDLRAGFESIYLEKLGLETELDPAFRELCAAVSAEQASFLLRRLNRALEELRFGDSPRLSLELGLFGCLEAASDLSDWVERLEALERRLSAGGAAEPQRAAAAPAPGPGVPRPAAPPPAQPHPAASRPVAEVPAVPAEGGFAAALEDIAKEKPSLVALLEKATLVRCETGPWKLIFARRFDADSAKRSQPLIEAKLATSFGRAVRLVFEVGETGQPAAEELVRSEVKEATMPGSGDWSDASESQAKPGSEPAPKPGAGGPLSKAQQILGGKMKIVKKPGS